MTSLDARRFRSNIISESAPNVHKPRSPYSHTYLVDDVEAYDEDSWKLIRFRAAPSGKSPDSKCHVSCRTVRSVYFLIYQAVTPTRRLLSNY